MEQNRIKFEEDYIFRNCRSITTSPHLALTELVANAWDDIFIDPYNNALENIKTFLGKSLCIWDMKHIII